MRRIVTGNDGQTFVDFGTIEDGSCKNKNIRVKVCGKTIWNYPSDKVVARAGWLHYSVIAKGSKLFDAIELCRNWVSICNCSPFMSEPYAEPYADHLLCCRKSFGISTFLPHSRTFRRLLGANGLVTGVTSRCCSSASFPTSKRNPPTSSL